MELVDERTAVARWAAQLRRDGLVTGTSGNVSARAGRRVAITPSGVDCGVLTPASVCVVDTDGVPAGGAGRPSSELPMHLAVYAGLDVSAIVHTHSPFATALSALVQELPPVHYLIAELGGPVRVAPYATFGSAELARGVVEALHGRTAAILANHGAVAVGATVAEAYARAVLLEELSALYYRCLVVGEPRLLDRDEIARVARRLETRAAGVTRGNLCGLAVER